MKPIVKLVPFNNFMNFTASFLFVHGDLSLHKLLANLFSMIYEYLVMRKVFIETADRLTYPVLERLLVFIIHTKRSRITIIRGALTAEPSYIVVW